MFFPLVNSLREVAYVGFGLRWAGLAKLDTLEILRTCLSDFEACGLRHAAEDQRTTHDSIPTTLVLMYYSILRTISRSAILDVVGAMVRWHAGFSLHGFLGWLKGRCNLYLLLGQGLTY